MKREKILFKQTYKKGTTVKREALPITRHTHTYQPVEMHLLTAGIIDRGGEKLEFQDIRLYFPRDPSDEKL
jgi:hypothetical protein